MPSKYDNEWNLEGDEDIPYDDFISKNREARGKRSTLYSSSVNEVGVVPALPPEIMAERERYKHDLNAALQEVFPESTGLKPFGKVQIDSTKFLQYIMHNKGRLVMLEPRAYAKTTRITNCALMCALEGVQPYIVVVASSQKKAEDILDDIKTELTTNDKLMEMYPATTSCFRHLSRSSQKSRRQTYGGEFTYIENSLDALHFPAVPGEPSTCCIIQTRPATNLKGLKHKIPSGPLKGRVIRPTLYIFDDPQTEDEAASPKMRSKIIKNIKRSALKGGTHQNPVSAVMAVTPVEYGDVAWHFVHKEDSFDLVRYKMVEAWPAKEVEDTMWYGKYVELRSNFDKEIRGDRRKARKEARQYVMDNFEIMHAGSEVTWEHAFNNDDPQYEISALQHAYNIIIDDGVEDFEYECQCNTEYGVYEEGETMHCPVAEIIQKTNVFAKRVVPQGCSQIVTHIDVNKNFLSYVTIASPPKLRPYVIDYGTWPEQTGRFSKSKIINPLKNLYPEPTDYRDVLYLACIDLFQFLAQMKYTREDGVKRKNNVIGIDMRFEEVYISRACRETPFSNVVLPCWGTFVGPDDDPLHERGYPEGVQVYENCVEVPNRDNTLDILKIDVNYFKTELHRALNKVLGTAGSMSLYDGNHLLFGEHCNSEYPSRVPGKKEIRTKIQWFEKGKQIDNEYFDNGSGCFALLCRQGVDMNPKAVNQDETVSERTVNTLEDLMARQSKTTLW